MPRDQSCPAEAAGKTGKSSGQPQGQSSVSATRGSLTSRSPGRSQQPPTTSRWHPHLLGDTTVKESWVCVLGPKLLCTP